MPVVGCPKCKKKFKLSNEMLGKTVRCTQCKTAFKTASQVNPKPKPGSVAKSDRRKSPAKKSANGGDAGAAQASAASLKDVGLSGPINPQMDLFAQPIPDQRAPNPLGNFVLEDPGFGDVNLEVDEAEDDVDTSSEEKKHLFENPALKAAAASKGKKKTQGKRKKPADFKEIRLLGNIVVGIGGIALVCYLVCIVLGVLGIIQMIGSGNQSQADNGGPTPIGFYVFVGGIVMDLLMYIVSFFYWPKALANTTALGAAGQNYTPMWMVLSWIIPLANLVWPMQGITEIYKASKRPSGKKWRKVKGVLWQVPTWTVAIIAAFTTLIVAGFWGDSTTSFTSSLIEVIGVALAALALICMMTLVLKITKTQYANFE